MPGPLRSESRFGRNDLGLLAIALAPEFDGRYERVYAYLQDDATPRWPSVELALDLLSGSAGAKLDARQRLAAAEAPLRRHRLVRIHQSEPGQALLSCRRSLDRQVIDFLLGHDGLDERLTAFAELMAPEPPASPPGETAVRLSRPSACARRGITGGRRPAHGHSPGGRSLAVRCGELASAKSPS